MLHPTFRLGLLLSVTALRLKSLVWRCIIRWGGRGWGRSFLSRTYPRSRRHRHQQLWNILQVRSIALHVQEDVVASLPGRCSCCCCSCGRSIAIATCTHVVVVVIGYCRCHLIFIWLVYLFNLWSAVGFLVGAILREYFLLRNSSFLPLSLSNIAPNLESVWIYRMIPLHMPWDGSIVCSWMGIGTSAERHTPPIGGNLAYNT